MAEAILSMILYLLFTFVGLWTVSVREQSAFRGREAKGEVISLKVSFKGWS